jgi:DNA-binding MarR family transcriptional regulator
LQDAFDEHYTEHHTPMPPARRQGPPLEAAAAYLLARLGQRQSAQFTTALEPHGLRPRHFQVLNVIALAAGISQQELGRRLGLDPSGMVATLDDLEERGFVERRRDPADRRRYQLHLTDTGAVKLSDARGSAQQVAQELLSPLSKQQRRQLHELLARVAGEHDDEG